jgi:hypothetical protein
MSGTSALHRVVRPQIETALAQSLSIYLCKENGSICSIIHVKGNAPTTRAH